MSFDIGARVLLETEAGEQEATVLRANSDGTYDITSHGSGDVIEGVDGGLLSVINSGLTRRTSNGSEGFDSDSEAPLSPMSETKKTIADTPDKQSEDEAARVIQRAARSRQDELKRRTDEVDTKEQAFEARIEQRRQIESSQQVNGLLLDDDDDDDGNIDAESQGSAELPGYVNGAAPNPALEPLGPSSADFSSLQDTLDHLTNRVNELTRLANAHESQLNHKDELIKTLFKMLKKTQEKAVKAMAKSYKHHANTSAAIQREHKRFKAEAQQKLTENAEAIKELQSQAADSGEERSELERRVAANHKQIQDNWETIKQYRATLESKADRVDVSSKVEKADVIQFIEERQSAWQIKQTQTINVSVEESTSTVVNKFQVIADRNKSSLEDEVHQAKEELADQIAALEQQIAEARGAAEMLAGVGQELQAGHTLQDHQITNLTASLEQTRSQMEAHNVPALRDGVDDLKQQLSALQEEATETQAESKKQIEAMQENVSNKEAAVEGLRSQVATLEEQQAQSKQELQGFAETQADHSEQLSLLHSRATARGRIKRKSRSSGETKTNGRPHTSSHRVRPRVKKSSVRPATAPHPTLSAGDEADNVGGVIGIRVSTPGGSGARGARSINGDGSVNYDGDSPHHVIPSGDWDENDSGEPESLDDDSRLNALERRMAQTVDILAASMTRIEKNMLSMGGAPGSADPLKRYPAESFTAHDERLRSIVSAYNSSSAYVAKKHRDVVLKIGDRRDKVRIRKGHAAGLPRRSPGSGPDYKGRTPSTMVDFHSGRNASGTWGFSAAQTAYRRKETRELAARARADSPMRNQLGRDSSPPLMMQEDDGF